MTQDQIIEMARQSGIDKNETDTHWAAQLSELEAFAKLVAAKEREACMELCEDADSYYAIRARGES